MTARESFADPALGDHVCLPFGSDDEKLSFTERFGRNAVARRQKLLVCTETAGPGELAARLGARIGGFARALAEGQAEILTCQDVYLTDGVFDPVRMLAGLRRAAECARELGYGGLWILVDMAWALRDVPGADRLHSFEATANQAFAEGGMAAACLYDRRRFPAGRLRLARCAHPLTPGQARLRFATTDDPPGLSLAGEADVTNRDALAAVLRPLRRRPGPVTIDASGLALADVAALRLLAATAAARAAWPTCIVATAPIAHLLRLVWAGTCAPLTVIEAEDSLTRLAEAEFDNGSLRIWSTLDPPGIRVAGTVDAGSQSVLEHVLAAAAARGEGDVHADFAGLRFIDVTGLRTLEAAARTLAPGRALVVRHLPAHVRDLVETLGWARFPGLRLPGQGPVSAAGPVRS